MAGAWVAAGVSGEEHATTAEDAARFQGDVLDELGDSPEVRVGLARYWSRFPSAIAVPCLAFHAGDESWSVAGAALEGLGLHATPESREVLHRYAHHDDNGIRLAAVLALAEMPDASDLEHLEFAFVESRGEIAAEVRFNALRTAAAIEGERAESLLRRGLLASDPFVRRTARLELQRRTGELAEAVSRPEPRADPVAGAGIDFAVADRNPIVEIVTSRGSMHFELFAAEAPNHVHSLLSLAARGHYDGLRFHRVVPDFVIQGGDERGDGNGGTTWRGSGSLRHEIGPRKYVRGSLGMPRNDDPDSGGSQIFVTHRPTPHLDGRYTIFGELRRGFEVLDAIEVGDTIRSVRRLP
jgi:cyclophilin family peptidyl-prolyl cis-trans isomerase